MCHRKRRVFYTDLVIYQGHDEERPICLDCWPGYALELELKHKKYNLGDGLTAYI